MVSLPHYISASGIVEKQKKHRLHRQVLHMSNSEEFFCYAWQIFCNPIKIDYTQRMKKKEKWFIFYCAVYWGLATKQQHLYREDWEGLASLQFCQGVSTGTSTTMGTDQVQFLWDWSSKSSAMEIIPHCSLDPGLFPWYSDIPERKWHTGMTRDLKAS